MPYISGNKRQRLQPFLDSFKDLGILEAGEINYLFTSMLIIQTENASRISYDLLNSFLGVLESIKLEFYRRMVSEYEDSKIQQNGDIYI